VRYQPTAITADVDRVVFEYVRQVPGEPDLAVADVLELAAGKIIASRGFHG
jgi:hypothetical protein